MTGGEVSPVRAKMALRYVAGRNLSLATALVGALDRDLAGLTEVAEAAGRGKTQVNNLTRRPGFPRPVVRLACGPVYSRAEVLAYLSQDSDESDDTGTSGKPSGGSCHEE